MKITRLILVLSLALITFGMGFFTYGKTHNNQIAKALPQSSTYATKPNGLGTLESPYLIYNGDELAWLAQYVNSGETNQYAKLKNNIELGTKIWTPIGTSSYSYNGVFDGDGYAIKNLIIDSTIEVENIGLFGSIGASATIKNLVIENSFIITAGTNGVEKNIGALAGRIYTSSTVSIQNVAIMGGYIKYIGENINSNKIVSLGGIVGRVIGDSSLTIQNSFSSANMLSPGANESYDYLSTLGGLVGYSENNINISVYNCYFTGSLHTNKATYQGTVYNSAGNLSVGTKRNVYYAYTRVSYESSIIPNPITLANYWRKSSDVPVYVKDQQPSIIYNLDIYDVFNDPTSPDRRMRVEENWYKDAESFPVLRGVGNRMVAIKDDKIVENDLSTTDNNSNVVRAIQGLYDTTSLSVTLHISKPDKTWETITQNLRLSGTTENQSSPYILNDNRLSSVSKTLTITESSRQGYYAIDITTVSLLHKHSFLVQDRATLENKIGTLEFCNISGELFLNTTSNFVGHSFMEGDWTQILNYDSANNVNIFTSNGSQIGVYAHISSAYHTQKLDVVSGEVVVDNNTNSFVAKSSDVIFKVSLVDIYELGFNVNEDLFESDSNLRPGDVDDFATTYNIDFLSSIKNYGGQESGLTGFSTIYISHSSGIIYNINYSGACKEKSIKPYPLPTSKGYNFDGWFDEAKQVRFSNGSGNYFGEVDLNTNNIRNLMSTQTIVVNGKDYFCGQTIMLSGIWLKQKHDVEYISLLDLNDFIDFDGPLSTLQIEQFMQSESVYEIGQDESSVYVVNDVKGFESVGHANSISNFAQTSDLIKVQASAEGAGFGLRAILIKTKNDTFLSSDFNSAPATFAETYTIGDAEWYKIYVYDGDLPPYIEINDIHDDLMIYAIYDDGTGKVNIDFSFSLPESNPETGFSMTYSVFDKNGNAVVEEQELTQSNHTITGLSPIQSLLITSMSVGSKFVFSSNEENRFIVGEPKDEDVFVIQQTPDELGIENNWYFESFIQLYTGFINEDKLVEFEIGIRYRGFSFYMQSGCENDGEIELLPVILPVEADQFPNYQIEDNSNEAIITANLVENVSYMCVFEVTISNQKMWTPKNPLQICIFERDSFVKIEGVSYSLNDLGNGKYSLSEIDGLLEGVVYNFYFVMEKTQYTIEITKQSDSAFVNEYIDGYLGDEKLEFVYDKCFLIVTFEQMVNLIFKMNNLGYTLSQIKVMDFQQSITDNQNQEVEMFSAYTLDPFADQIEPNTPIPVTVSAAPKSTEYHVEYYKESLTEDGVYELDGSPIVVSENVFVGDVATIIPDNNKYIGYTYFSHPNEKLSAVVTFAGAELTILSVYYSAIAYHIIYNGNGNTAGTVPQTQDVKFGRSFEVSENTFTKTGYNFLHWDKTENDSGTTKYNPAASVIVNQEFIYTAVNENIVFYAIWQEKTIQIIYSAPDATGFSASWENLTDYTVFSNSKTATSVVTFDHPYGYLNSTIYSTLITPSRVSYDFDGWFTQEEGGIKITADTIVDIDEETTFYAYWTHQTATIEFRTNITGVSLNLSYDSKTLYVGDEFVDEDIYTHINSGFPTDEWTSIEVFELLGWAFESTPSGSISYLTETSQVPAGESTIYVFAHWKPVAPTLNEGDWLSVKTYNANLQKTLEVGTNSTLDKYITNFSSGSGITYKYSWSKDGVLIGQSTNALFLKNVADSGTYKVEIYAHHDTWGNSLITSVTGLVTISKEILTVSATNVEGIITKVYDNTTNVFGVTTSNTGILRATAVFDNSFVGIDKSVTFSLTFITDDPNNYSIFYNEVEIENAENLTTFEFVDSTAKITPYDLVIDIGSLSNYANGTNHKILASAISLSPEDDSFLGSAGQTLGGYVETADAIAGIYTGASLVNFLTVKAGINDRTSNYDITINGSYQIIEGVLKTLVINKTAILDKDTQITQIVNTSKFVIRYGANDISNTGVYNINGYYFNVRNDADTDQITISTDEFFADSILIIPSAFTFVVGQYTTQAVVYKWQEEGEIERASTAIEYDFSNIIVDFENTVTVLFVNYSTIIYNTRISATPFATQTVYNTVSGIEVTHITESQISQTGLTFVGWYMSVAEDATIAPTLWKGYGDINIYARWNVDEPNVKTQNDGSTFSSSILQTYDGNYHNLSYIIENLNPSLIYSHTWKVGTQTITDDQYQFKNVVNQTIILTVTAQLLFDETLYQTKSSVLTINLIVTQLVFDYSKDVEKVFDGNSTILSPAGNYVLVDIDLGDVTETLKLTGSYSSKYAAVDIALTGAKLENYLTYLVSNYSWSISALGTITPRTLENVDIENDETNQKVYDTTPYTALKEEVASTNLVAGNVLNITIQTISASVDLYNAENGEIIVLDWSVYDGTENITSSYTLESIIGSAKITKQENLNTADILLVNTTLTYDGNEMFVNANIDAFSGGEIPSDVELVYTWKVSGQEEVYAYENGSAPIEVGDYIVFLTVVADENNYTILGTNPLFATLKIEVRHVELDILSNVFYGQDEIENIIIDTKTASHSVSSLPLADGHYMDGSVWANSNLPGIYTEENGTLLSNLRIYYQDVTGDVDVTANYEIAILGYIEIIHYYFIAYNAGLGSGTMATEQIEYGQEVFLSANLFVRDGYDYSHWNTSIDGTGISYEEREVVFNLLDHDETLTLYPMWTPANNTPYYVEYYLQNLDGSYNETSNFEEIYISTTENQIELDPNYSSGNLVDDYNFLVYQNGEVVSNTTFDKQFEGFTSVVNEYSVLSITVDPVSLGSKTLKLYYQRNTYTLTLFKNNFDVPSQIQTQYLFEQQIEEPAEPSRAGYDFEGWYIYYPDPQSYLMIWPFSMPAEDVELWAIYVANENTPYKVEFYEQDIDGSYSALPSRVENRAGRTDSYAYIEITQNEGVITGATLRMYTTEEKITQIGVDYVIDVNITGMNLVTHLSQVLSGQIVADSPLVLKVYYEREIYDLTRVLHNGQSNITTNYRYGEQIIQPSMPVYIGYVFDGWYLDYNADTKIYSNSITWPITSTKDLTIYAKWKPSDNTEYKVSIYFEKIDGTYNTTADTLKTLTSTTNYYAIFTQELIGEVMSNVVAIYEDDTMSSRKGTESPFDYTGFSLDELSSTLFTNIEPDGSGELVLYFVRNMYSVLFVYNNGELDSSSTAVKYQAQITKPTDPTNLGYIFAGWYFDISLTQAVSWPYTVVNGTTIMYAKWNSATDTPYKLEIYKQNVSGEYPAIPLYEDFTGTTDQYVAVEQDLIGGEYVWNLKVYTDSTKTTLVNIIKSIEITGYTYNINGETIEKVISADGLMFIKLYYTLNSYSFIAQLNNGQDDEQQSVLFGEKPIMPDNPTLIGFVFVDWYIDVALTTIFQIEAFSMPAYDYTIYAKWSPAKDTPFILEYYLQNIDTTYNLIPSETQNFVGTTNQYVEIESWVLNTYETSTKTVLLKDESIKTFIGFTYSNNILESLSGTINPNGSLTLKTYLIRNTYSVTFHYNNGDDDLIIGNVMFEDIITQPIPVRTGYDFDSWYYENTFTNKVEWTESGEDLSYIMEAQNVDMYAHWSPRNDTPFAVEHYLQNANDDIFMLYETKNYTGVTATTVDAQVQTYAGFVQDVANENNILSGVVAGDGTLVLKVYYIRQIYQLIFNGNANTSGSMENMAFKYGQTLVLTANAFIRDGYNFIGWTDIAAGVIVKFANLANYTFGKTQDINIYALWQIKPLLDATLTSSVASGIIYFGNTLTLTANASHSASATITYQWYYNETLMAHNLPSLEITERSQSGTYIVNIIVQGNITQGVQGNTTSLLTNEQAVLVNQRIVYVDFEIGSYVYNGNQQNPTYSVEYYIEEGIDSPTLSIGVPSASHQYLFDEQVVAQCVHVGLYEIVVTLNPTDNFIVNGASTTSFEITKLDWDISSLVEVGEFSKEYSYPSAIDPEKSKTLTNPNTSEKITILFDREAGEDIGLYNLTLSNANLLYTDYNIILAAENQGFAISKSASGTAQISFVNTTILNKVYDGEKIDVNDEAFDLSNLAITNGATLLSANFEILSSSKNVGVYEILLVSATSLEYENITLDNQYFYVINQSQLDYITTSITKAYDGQTSFGHIDFSNAAIVDNELVDVVATYSSVDVGSSIPMQISLVGSAKANYKLGASFAGIVGSITPRFIRVIAESGVSVEYGTSQPALNYEVFAENTDTGLFDQSVDNSQISGQLVLNPENPKFTVQTYDIGIGTLTTSSNYIIFDFISSTLEVTPKPISAIADWNKIYDGTTDFSKPITLFGIIDGDDITAQAVYSSELVGSNITLNISLLGSDAFNYDLQNPTATGLIEYKYVTALLDYQFESLSSPEHSALAETSLNLIYNQTIKQSGYAELPIPTAIGYVFAGWYDDLLAGVLFTKDTLVNETNWQEDIEEKTLYARWNTGEVEIAVGVVSYSSAVYTIENMSGILVGGTFSIDGVDYSVGGNTKNAEFLSEVILVAQPNADYDFVGWYQTAAIDSLLVESNEIFEPYGTTLVVQMNNNITVFAKFKLKTAIIILDTNASTTPASVIGDYLSWDIEYGNGVESLSSTHDLHTIITLPSSIELTRQGYSFVGWWTEQVYTSGSLFLGDISLEQDTNLFAIWQSVDYTAAFVASTGTEDEALLNSDKGSFENPTDPAHPDIFEKTIPFEQMFGVIEEPTRLRYTFAGWYENLDFDGDLYTSESVYNFNEDKTFYAKWIENTYIITIQAIQVIGGSIIVEQSSGVLSVSRQDIGANQTIIVTLLASSSLHIIASSVIGYDVSYSNAYQNGVDITEVLTQSAEVCEVTISRFAQNIDFGITFLSQLHEIEVLVNNTTQGEILVTAQNLIGELIRNEVIEDTQRIDDQSIENSQRFIVSVFTGETISIQINANLGYKISGLLRVSGSGEFTSLSENMTQFVGFTTDGVVNIAFEEQTHAIAVRVGKDIVTQQISNEYGSFAVSVEDALGNITVIQNNAIANNVDSLVQIKTNQKLIINTSANHGYEPSEILANYTFVPTNEIYSLGSFDLSKIGEGTIEFTAFNSGGEIILPFTRLLYSLSIGVAFLDDGIFTEIAEPSSYALANITTPFDEGEQFYYQKPLNIQATSEYGYQFVGWYNSLQETGAFSTQAIYSNYILLDNTQIFAVVEYITHTITYEVSDYGYISGQSTQYVKHNHDGESVVATASLGYEFEKWEIYNDVSLNWEIDTINIQANRQEFAVYKDLKLRAVFIASDIEISFASKCIIDTDLQGGFIFAELVTEDIGIMQVVGQEISGTAFAIISKTGQLVNILALANPGYSVRGWTLSTGSQAKIVENNGKQDVTLEDFKENLVVTVLFEANENVFEIAVAKIFGNDFNFSSSQFVEGGTVNIDPSLYLSTQPYQSRVLASVRTEKTFDVSYYILNGYKLVYDEIEPTKVKVGIRYDNEDEVVFVESMTISELFGIYTNEVSFTMEGFVTGGTIVVFVEEDLYDVTFHKTDTESRIYQLKINSTFTILDADYKVPTRVGYIFDGWYSQPNGQGIYYINERGEVLREWAIEHANLYANWSRAYVTYNLVYVPSENITDGPLGWNVREDELKQAVNTRTYQYYVGIETYFEAQPGLEGYQFAYWMKDDLIVSQQNNYYFEIDENESDFEQSLYIIYKVKISVSSTNGGTASIQGGASFKYLLGDQTATLIAVVANGYEFLGWRVRGTTQILSTDEEYIVSYSPVAITYEAVFAGKQVEIIVQNGEKGNVESWLINGAVPISENGKYFARFGDSITFVTIPQSGYVLTSWLINDVNNAKFEYYEVSYADIENENITFMPVFVLIDINYEILFASSGEVRVNNQSITNGRAFTTNYYEYVTFAFNPTIRYKFQSIAINGTVIANEYATQNGSIYLANIPATMLSLTAVNKIQLSFEMIYWLDVKIPFEGVGTEQNPYLITSANNFAQMAYLINNGIAVDSSSKVEYDSAYYLLSASVDFAERFWVPIGTEEHPFNGVIRLEYSRRNIVLDRGYTTTRLDGLFGFVTDKAEFIVEHQDITTAIIIFSSVGAVLISIATTFIIKIYTKRKRLRMQSRIFPTDRPFKR